MEFYLLGLAIIIALMVMKSSNISQRKTSEHNTKVFIDNTLDDAYKNTRSTTLIKVLEELESRYADLVKQGIERFRSKFKNTSNEQYAIFLDFDRVFSVEEYAIIAKYEAINNRINSRLQKKDRKISAYKKAIRLLELEYNMPYLSYNDEF